MQITKKISIIAKNFSWAEPDMEIGIELYEYDNALYTYVYSFSRFNYASFRILRLCK